MLRPVVATKENDYIGEDCALCKQPFAPDTELVVCPQDGVLHHTYCWEANNCHCTALACEGHGRLIRSDSAEPEPESEPDTTIDVTPPPRPPRVVITEPQTQPSPPPRPNRRPRPSRPTPAARQPRPAPQSTRTPFTLQLAQSCVVLAIAIAIIVISFSCFGLWAIADYLMIEVFDFNYRPIP